MRADAEAFAARAPVRRPSRARRVATGLLASASALVLAFLACELAVRCYVQEGFVAGLRTFFVPDAAPRALRDPDADNSFLPDPELGYVLNPAVEGIDAHGVRHGPIALPKPADVFRLIVVGDSVAWQPDGFADRLGGRLAPSDGRRLELVNASVPGYTTYQERLFVERTLADLEPDLVLLQYCLNDNHRFLHRINAHGDRLFTPEAKRALLPEGDGLVSRFLRWSWLLVEVRRRLYARRLRTESPFDWVGREDFSTAWKESTWPEIEEHVLAVRDAVAARGARFAVVAVPYEPQLRDELLALDREYVLKPQSLLRGICERAGIPFLDLFETLRAGRGAVPAEDGRRDEPLYLDGIHLSPRGHALATEAVARFLEHEGLVS